MVGDDGLIFSNGFWQPGVATILGVADLSISPSGQVWMVKTDGSGWTTTDGRSQLRRADLIARVSADYVDNVYAVALPPRVHS